MRDLYIYWVWYNTSRFFPFHQTLLQDRKWQMYVYIRFRRCVVYIDKAPRKLLIACSIMHPANLYIVLSIYLYDIQYSKSCSHRVRCINIYVSRNRRRYIYIFFVHWQVSCMQGCIYVCPSLYSYYFIAWADIINSDTRFFFFYWWKLSLTSLFVHSSFVYNNGLPACRI